MDSDQHIRYDVADRVATITLDRPDKLNAFTRLMRDQLIAAFGRADFCSPAAAAITWRRVTFSVCCPQLSKKKEAWLMSYTAEVKPRITPSCSQCRRPVI